jgi:hypothetical protein
MIAGARLTPLAATFGSDLRSSSLRFLSVMLSCALCWQHPFPDSCARSLPSGDDVAAQDLPGRAKDLYALFIADGAFLIATLGWFC